MTKTDTQLLDIKNLVMHFRTSAGPVQAVDGVDFSLDYNKAVVVLGESGCGKSSLAKAILRLLPRNIARYDGSVFLEGVDVMKYAEEDFRTKVRWISMSMVPQASMNALNPVLKVGDQVAEPAMVHMGVRKDEAYALAAQMFQRVGVPVDFLNRYAFELSGGMRQRVAIAMSLITSPDLIILDEPTSALDVLTQANIMNVLKLIKQNLGTSFILITHDIATSSELADVVAVMYAGQMVEVADAQHFFPMPYHPYSKMLMASVPKLRSDEDPIFIVGQPPSLIGLKPGCRFAPRCPSRFEKCDQDPPVFERDGRTVRCWLYEK